MREFFSSTERVILPRGEGPRCRERAHKYRGDSQIRGSLRGLLDFDGVAAGGQRGFDDLDDILVGGLGLALKPLLFIRDRHDGNLDDRKVGGHQTPGDGPTASEKPKHRVQPLGRQTVADIVHQPETSQRNLKHQYV